MKIKKYIKALWKYITNPRYRFLINAGLGKYNKMPDEEYLKKMYYATMGKQLNLDNPQTFNEKLQWLKLHNRKDIYTVMVDKYLVRDYIKEKLGEEYLIPLLGVYDKPEDIDFDKLPNQFVLKCNHNSGLGMYICKDKSKLTKRDFKKIRKELSRGLKEDYYLSGREWPYKNVPRKIICEQYMVDSETKDLYDYKFFCFNGVVKCYKVDFDRFIKHRANYYNKDGEILKLGEDAFPPDFNKNIKQSKNIEKMEELAADLTKAEPFLRADFYDVNGKIYFGELTFYPASGFGKFIFDNNDEMMGSWITLPDLAEGGEVNPSYVMFYQNLICVLKASSKQHTNLITNESLTDYKFFCFNGYVDSVMVCLDRSSGDTKYYFFDKDWKFKRINVRGKNAPADFTLSKPSCIDKMFDIASFLSKDLPFARVDLYQCDNQIYFGELTFYPTSGFDPNLLLQTDEYFGKLINIGK